MNTEKEIAVIVYSDGTQESVPPQPERDQFERPGYKYTEEQKTKVVMLWLSTSNLTEVAKITGIPHQTIKEWRGQPWWNQYVAEITDRDLNRKKGKLAKVAETTLDLIQEQIQHGEYFWDAKTGKLKRKPARIADLTNTMKTVVNMQTLIETMQSQKVQVSDTNKRLEQIAEQFAKFTKTATNASAKKTFDNDTQQEIEDVE